MTGSISKTPSKTSVKKKSKKSSIKKPKLRKSLSLRQKKLSLLLDDINSSESDKAENESEVEVDALEASHIFESKTLDDVLVENEDVSFSSLSSYEVSEMTLKAVDEMGYQFMRDVQHKCIPPALEGKDLVVSAKTGSGRTLGFLIPAIELLYKHNHSSGDGTGVIIIAPNRELAFQIYGVLVKLLKYHCYTAGLLIGGKKDCIEIDIAVTTPGKLLHVLENLKKFSCKRLKSLIVDEADELLAEHFQSQMEKIIGLLPAKRQTMLFSATMIKSLDFAKISSGKNPLYIKVDDTKAVPPTAAGLEQSYLICPAEKRLLFLVTFLRYNFNKKVMVFFSSFNSVRYHKDLLKALNIPVKCIFSKQLQRQRTATFLDFYKAEKGVLLCTDIAARGWDIPAVDWIVQYDAPCRLQEYIQRVGAAARGVNSTGRAVLVLMPEEDSFVSYLLKNQIPVKKHDFLWFEKLDNEDLDALIKSANIHRRTAVMAYKAYFRAYAKHELKSVFKVDQLNINKIAKSFGLEFTPNPPGKVRQFME